MNPGSLAPENMFSTKTLYCLFLMTAPHKQTMDAAFLKSHTSEGRTGSWKYKQVWEGPWALGGTPEFTQSMSDPLSQHVGDVKSRYPTPDSFF